MLRQQITRGMDQTNHPLAHLTGAGMGGMATGGMAMDGMTMPMSMSWSPGRYALMAYHDENANGKLDLRLGMFPIEGYGLSRNPKVMGPPAFEDSAFELGAEGGAQQIEMRY